MAQLRATVDPPLATIELASPADDIVRLHLTRGTTGWPFAIGGEHKTQRVFRTHLGEEIPGLAHPKEQP